MFPAGDRWCVYICYEENTYKTYYIFEVFPIVTSDIGGVKSNSGILRNFWHGGSKLETSPFGSNSHISFTDKYALLLTGRHESGERYINRLDYANGKESFIDVSGDDFQLLGDYLYRRDHGHWFRANISEGTDDLRWEMVNFDWYFH